MSPASRYFNRALVSGRPFYRFFQKKNLEVDFNDLLKILEFTHVSVGLLKAYREDYPLVEPRELIPTFDAPLIEYKNLPAFSMAAFDRPVSYQDEGFQFDLLEDEGRPFDSSVAANNRQVLRERLPRDQIGYMEAFLGRKGITSIPRYRQVLPLICKMDRGHVIARNPQDEFYLCGVFASFPSNLDGEIKRFDRQINKFKSGDNDQYAANRQFVYRFLMEQSGFSICGERHTSAALFARRLMRRREQFVVKVLGASDRTITSFIPMGAKGRLPRVEKVALVQARDLSPDNEQLLAKGGFYVDRARRVVILKVAYQQHAYHKDNVLEDRALSVARQEVIHPRSGETISVDILGINQDRLLALNDIVRGEFQGSIVYKRKEQISSTREISNRLKVLCSWLDKHRHILSDYSPDNFERIQRILHSFMDSPELLEDFYRNEDLVAQVRASMAHLRVAHRLRLVEKLVHNRSDASGRQLQHVHVLIILVHFLAQEGAALCRKHPSSLRKLLNLCRKQLTNPYIKRRYLSRPPRTAMEREMMGEHRLLTRLVDRYEKQLGN